MNAAAGVSDEPAPARQGFDRKKLALLLLVAAALAAFFALGGPRWLSLDTLQENRERLRAFTGHHYVAVLAAAALIYATATALSFPGAIVLTLAAGFLFGPWVGTAVVVTGATVGATAAFLGARYVFADAARRRMGPRLRKLTAGFEEDGLSYMLFLRLVPVFPFWLVNLAPALTSLPTRTYVLATAVGIVPGSFVYCYLGARLSTLRSPSDVYRDPRWLLALGLLAALSLAPVAWKKFRSRPESGA
ncbi:MAG TPA: TVP38/TMEM64 family protein [Longimicrobiaceae bacterium]|nr:TVP38/TMEM64 family protein [Longimicrobiaceae bacterium]